MFREISPYEINDNTFKMIDKDWMLITAAKDGVPNSMTASWGCLGILWNKPIAVCFVRPQRYTYEFCEAADTLSLSFFDPAWRDALKLCGTKSGRDTDKYAATGLTPVFDQKTPYLAQARTVLLCKKLYTDDLKKQNFLDPALLKNYPIDDFHRVYICEITKVLVKE